MKYSRVFFIFIFISCNRYVEKNNDSADVSTGKIMTTQFYEYMSKGDRDKIYLMCSDSLSVKDFKNLLHVKDSILGDIVKIEIIDVNTSDVNSDDTDRTKYLIELKVKYQRGENEETVEFVKDESGDEILQSYNFKPIWGNVSNG